MLTVYESSHSPFWNNASEADHWETEIRCYNSLGSFLESNPGTLVERVCQHPPAKQSDGFVKLPHSLISFAFYLSSQNWRVRCSPKSLYPALWILVFTSGETWPQASLNRSLFDALEKLKACNSVYKQFNVYEKNISDGLPEETIGIKAQLLELQHSTELLQSNM